MRIIASAVLAATVVFGGAGSALAADDPETVGAAANSPGILSGNVVQIPIDVLLNACGNSINLVGLLNPTAGNVCVNAND
ncbi:chaplin [Streptomyces sp. NPDC093094]|uniref:chaplin n=1 Tax=Streptomyces sp. NPDC093094 TaxID=3366026 RepID=UPI00380B35F3